MLSLNYLKDHPLPQAERVQRPPTEELNNLMVYGIFLGFHARNNYGMSNPRYSVVKDYATVPLGGHIVAATPLEGYDLTGLYVDVDPDFWDSIDLLESAYDRIKVTTFRGEAWLYVKPNQHTRD